jgi:CheY-like chemotaxis protein
MDTTGETAKALRILSVEDHSDTRRLLDHMLGEDAEITTSPGLEEALTALDSAEFDLLLIDINLGAGKNGVDLLRRVRRGEDSTEIPAIAVTAYAMPGDRDDLLSEGFDGYVGKPFARQDLIETIEQVL